MGSVRRWATRRAQNLAKYLANDHWEKGDSQWSRRRPRRFRSAEDLQGLCLQIQRVLGEGEGVVLNCGGGEVAVGPSFDRIVQSLDLYSPTARRTLILREKNRLWTVSFDSTWGTAVIPVGIQYISQPPPRGPLLEEVARLIDEATLPYGRWRRLMKAPLVEPYTGRDVRTRAHDLKVAAFAVAGGLVSGAISGWLAGVLARPS